jgi:ADP-heptose:LPS heptosyltransferase
MERNRRINEGFLGELVAVQPLSLNEERAKPVALPHPYVVLSLGAGQDFRIWPAARFAQVTGYLLNHYADYRVILTGTHNEKTYSDAMLAHLPDHSRVIDKTGELSIAELIYVVSKAQLLITNETGIVHIAASTQTTTIVISQGKSLVRWHPYPADVSLVIHYLYPADVETHRSDLLSIADRFNPESPLSINDIPTERVINLLRTLLDQLAVA